MIIATHGREGKEKKDFSVTVFWGEKQQTRVPAQPLEKRKQLERRP